MFERLKEKAHEIVSPVRLLFIEWVLLLDPT